ncbi:hypothetical protein [Rhizobium binae]|uniref:hypothetical protein n=1 Tax=Rhizobium binae TaxID=1138190 RepID=UPI001C838710|nr:hypothetical protein [Rhizobium binae]MBX4928090.1 hypothetical protein [Rhizobium binae]MBX4938252.1 hypothetical protein [Rhizobium binae]MBX4944758.1 hypothetical protein [Rhizobium binae]MBX4951897.1 hypothetical protein [Rhizobium binae]MBX4962063.1 hypothetical protein [Rhizobium binae]
MATIGFVMFAPVKSSACRFCRQNGGEVNVWLRLAANFRQRLVVASVLAANLLILMGACVLPYYRLDAKG